MNMLKKQGFFKNSPLGKKILVYLFFILVLVSLVCSMVPDADRDGVPDMEDKCDNSIGLVDVYGCTCLDKLESGCEGEWCCMDGAICEEYDFRASCMYDLDSDGVYHIEDRCPYTKIGEIVDSSGCSCLQKTCDDKNLCTDDHCDYKADCVFTANDANYCGDGRSCESGVCVWGDDESSDISYWSYDSELGEIRIFYSHSRHIISVSFQDALEDNIIIMDSTSNIISHDLSEDRTTLTLTVEGDSGVRGATTIKASQKPLSVSIDEIEIPERRERQSPRNYSWLYASMFLLMALLFTVLMLSQRRHENKMLNSIRKREKSIGREVDLEAELQLKMYITTNLKRGYTAQQLRQGLLKDGWKKEIVDRAFQSLRK
ncbi:hypothetical protein KY366_01125 [Candidatus Woesearchaeota archaeon]|nr:hypothetical protein [Candidatus Woesearchaeota archaeon]